MIGFMILNYNSSELSSKLAEKVSRFKRIDKVIIVDNCSTDNSYNNLCRIVSDKIILIKSKKNGGYSYGNNYGAKFADSIGIDILFVSNPDVDINEVDINMLIDSFVETDYSVLSGVEFDINKNMSQPPIWKPMTYLDDLLACFYIGRRLKENKGLKLDTDNLIQDVKLVKGSFFGVKLTDYLKVGGFDEGTFLFCEERIFGKKMDYIGAKVGIVTASKYYHNHSATINKAYKKIHDQMKLLYKSKLYYYDHYTQIGYLRRLVLVISMRLSLLEFRIRDIVKSK